METQTGLIYQNQLKELSISAVYKKEHIGAQVATYYYDLENPTDITKIKKDKTVETLNAYNHIKASIKIETGPDYCFTLTIPIKNKQPLFYGNLTFDGPTQSADNALMYIGRANDNTTIKLQLKQSPHILVAGTTGSGKSVLLNTIISSLYHTTDKSVFELVIIDNKRVEFQRYKTIDNVKLIEESNEAVAYLSDLVNEMERRYIFLEANPGASLKPIIVIVDELADLMLSSRYEVEESIVRLAQKARACNIHLILATQRPTVNVISGLIKANISTRIALKTASIRDSINILDHKGAETLLGSGDALLKLPDRVDEIRFQCALTSSKAWENIRSKI